MLYEEVVKETSVVKSGFSLISSWTFSLDFFEDFQDAFFWENLWRAACTVDVECAFGRLDVKEGIWI